MSTGSTPTPAENPIVSFVLGKLLGALNGYKTYIAAVGLFGLALYDASTSDYVGAYQSFMAALAAVGIRHAIAKAS